MKQIVRVVVRLRGRSTLAKLDQARFTVTKMKGNANFTALAAQVAELEIAADTLDSAITMARTGDHELVGLKQIAEDVLMAQLAKLCDSINGEAAGDKSKLLTCGLPMRRENEPFGELPPPTKLVSRLTSTRGRASLVWNGPAGTRVYNMYISTTNSPYVWTLVSSTTKQRFNVDGLEPGKFYYFAVSAIGSAGESSKSEPAEVMAAA
ncbi:MAG: fibronectin type III domain-containing protein [Flavobacteriales bacterium]|nr:fibronectin type III domain-containing protein [Flavobacteriales bacterium]